MNLFRIFYSIALLVRGYNINRESGKSRKEIVREFCFAGCLVVVLILVLSIVAIGFVLFWMFHL